MAMVNMQLTSRVIASAGPSGCHRRSHQPPRVPPERRGHRETANSPVDVPSTSWPQTTQRE